MTVGADTDTGPEVEHNVSVPSLTLWAVAVAGRPVTASEVRDIIAEFSDRDGAYSYVCEQLRRHTAHGLLTRRPRRTNRPGKDPFEYVLRDLGGNPVVIETPEIPFSGGVTADDEVSTDG